MRNNNAQAYIRGMVTGKMNDLENWTVLMHKDGYGRIAHHGCPKGTHSPNVVTSLIHNLVCWKCRQLIPDIIKEVAMLGAYKKDTRQPPRSAR